MLTKRYATGLAFVIIGCCGNGSGWMAIIAGVLGVYWMVTGDKQEGGNAG